MKFQYLTLLALMLGVVLTGCSAINFGIGAALDGPNKVVQQNTYRPEPVHIPQFRVKYVKVYTGDGVVYEFKGPSAFFVREKGKGFIGINPNRELYLERTDGSSAAGYLSSLKQLEGKEVIELMHESGHGNHIIIPTSEVSRFRFYPLQMDTLGITYGSGYGDSSPGLQKDYTVKAEGIEGFYLGFIKQGPGEDPCYLRPRDIEKVVYRQPMGMTPYFMAGVGLVADLVVGVVLLLR